MDLEELPTLLLDLQHPRRISLPQGHRSPYKYERKNYMMLLIASSQAIFPFKGENNLVHLLQVSPRDSRADLTAVDEVELVSSTEDVEEE